MLPSLNYSELFYHAYCTFFHFNLFPSFHHASYTLSLLRTVGRTMAYGRIVGGGIVCRGIVVEGLFVEGLLVGGSLVEVLQVKWKGYK